MVWKVLFPKLHRKCHEKVKAFGGKKKKNFEIQACFILVNTLCELLGVHYMNYYFFMHPRIDSYLGYFHFLALVTSPAPTIPVHVCFWVPVSNSGCSVSGSGVAGSWEAGPSEQSPQYSAARYIILPSHHQWMRVPTSPLPCPCALLPIIYFILFHPLDIFKDVPVPRSELTRIQHFSEKH